MDDLRKAAEMALEWIEAQPVPRMIGAQACIEALRKALTEDSTIACEWVGLTHEEIDYQAKKDDHAVYFALGALWAEAKLKEKNT